MHERSPGALGWMRDLLKGRKRDSAEFAGQPALATGGMALRSTERLFCDAICHADPGRVDGRAPEDRADAVNVFGRLVTETFAPDTRGVVGAATGFTLAGQRAAAFVPAAGLTAVHEQILAACEQRLPLVLHATFQPYAPTGDDPTGGHRGYHDVADAGAFQMLAKNAQQASDLALVARSVAELALTPGIVAVDGCKTAWAPQDLRLPAPELVREFLGDTSRTIDSPTPAQGLLFGPQRRRVPRWFDPDRPVAHGAGLSGPEYDAAVAGRRAFFADHVEAVARESMEVLSRLTGRPLGFVETHRVDDAKWILVAQGSTVETATAVADHLRKTQRLKVGVLGVTSLRPFPRDEIRQALSNPEAVTVLERADETVGELPLLREVRAALRGNGPRLLSAAYHRLDAEDIVAVCRNMEAGAKARPTVRLGVAPPSIGSTFPKREALLQRIRRHYPGLEEETLTPAAPLDVGPVDATTVVLHVRCAAPPENLARLLAEQVTARVGSHVRGRTCRAAPGTWHVRVTAAAEPFADAGNRGPVDVALIAGLDSVAEANPFIDVVPAGTVVLATGRDAAQLWSTMPAEWREAIRERDLRLFRMQGGPVDLIAAAAARDRDEEGNLEEIPWRDFVHAEAQPVKEPELPIAVRRFDHAGTEYDNVSRFWGELIEPRSKRPGRPAVPDPYLSVDVIPACTATFHDRTAQREQLPGIDPELCTGCGRCWAACPDSAIAPVAISTEALLKAAAATVTFAADSEEQAVAAKLERVARQLAGRVDRQLAKAAQDATPTVTTETLTESFDWLTEQMNVAGDELPAHRRVFEAWLEWLGPLPLSVTEPFFLSAEAEQKGSGELLMLAINTQACQGCGICAAACPEAAVTVAPQTDEAVDAARAVWRAWETLPDTAGKSIARAAERSDVGPLPSILLSRHSLFSVLGGADDDPGSGGRLAVRQIAFVVEYAMQRRALSHVKELEELSVRLREAIREKMAQAASVEDLGHLDQALDEISRQRARAAEVLARLQELGEATDIDVISVRRLVHVAQQVEKTHWRMIKGDQGLGRARFGIVVAQGSLRDGVVQFPYNPFNVPVAVDRSGHAADLASGLLEALAAERLEETRQVRLARLALEAPTDLPEKERGLARLSRRDLTAEELRLCPPVLLLCGADIFAGPGLAGVSRLLLSDLPVKIVVLDDHDLPPNGPDPTLLGLGHRAAFVLATSPAHPEQLFEGLMAALDHPGPALIHVYAPNPRRHGFESNATLVRAGLGVDSRVHPLVRYDPAMEGGLSLRLGIGGNPVPEQPWASDGEGRFLTPAEWAAGESRFAGAEVAVRAAIEDRLENWRTLQQLSGTTGPLIETAREQVGQELHDAHQAELQALKAEYEKKIADLEQSQLADQASRLRDRLMQLAGYGASGRGPSGPKGEST